MGVGFPGAIQDCPTYIYIYIYRDTCQRLLNLVNSMANCISPGERMFRQMVHPSCLHARKRRVGVWVALLK